MQPGGAHATQDADEFAEFVASRQRQLQRAAWLLTGDWTAAEDLVQTALAKTWRHWRKVQAADDPDAYVHRVLVNSFASGWRRRWRGEQPTETIPDSLIADVADEVSTRLSVQAALARLPRRQRAVLVLRYFQDMSEAQVAEAMGCAVGTVKSTSDKAITRLRAEPMLTGLLDTVQP